MTNRIGQQLGNYRLIQLVGQGSFADVYLGEHSYLGTQVAIKILQTRLTTDDVERFRAEARTIAGLKHPHIVRVLDFGVEEGTPYFVMNYAPNGSLRQQYPRGTRLPLETIVAYVKQVADALQYAHQRTLIHGDIKPENMLLGTNSEILLSDFGVATLGQSSHNRDIEPAVGTIYYMAPEQIQGKPQFASDQYALGVVVYEWLCCEYPFSGSFTEVATQHLFTPPPPLREKVPMLPPAVEEVVLRALDKDPQRRFASIQAFTDALEQASKPASSASEPLNISTPTISQKEERTVPALKGIGPTPSTSPSIIRKPIAPRWNLSTSKKVLLIGIALLILLGGGGLLAYNVNQTAASRAHATATAQANASVAARAATSTSNAEGTATTMAANATATVEAQANATAAANATVTANNPDPYSPPDWSLAFVQPLTGSGYHYWTEYTPNPTDRCRYINGAYHVIISQNSGFFGCYSAINSPDFAFEVQMKIITGDCGGIIFRGNNLNQQQFSLFTVCQNGSYDLYSYTSNNPVQTLISSSSSAINAGLNQTNTVAIVANGSSLDLYVNHQKINHIDNSTTDCMPNGICQIGLAVISYNSGTEVAYSSARAWSPLGTWPG